MDKYFEDIRDEELFKGVNFNDFNNIDSEHIKNVNMDLLEADELINFANIISKIEAYLGINPINIELVKNGISNDYINDLVKLILEGSDNITEIKEKASLFKEIQIASDKNNLAYKKIQSDDLQSIFYKVLNNLESLKNGDITSGSTFDGALFNGSEYIFDELYTNLQKIYSNLNSSGNLGLLEELGINNDLLQKIRDAFLKNLLSISIINKDLTLRGKYKNYPISNPEEEKKIVA